MVTFYIGHYGSRLGIGEREMSKSDRAFPTYDLRKGYDGIENKSSMEIPKEPFETITIRKGLDGRYERKPARPFPTHHLHKAFDKDSDNTIPIIFGIMIIGLITLWVILGAA